MKISIVTGPWLPVPPIQGGAIERIWQGIAEVFASQGHTVTFLCRSYPLQPKWEIYQGVRYIRQGGFSQSTSIGLDLLKDFIYASRKFYTLPPADISIVNDFWLPCLVPLRSDLGRIVVHLSRMPKGQCRLYQGIDSFVVPSQSIAEAVLKQDPGGLYRINVIPYPVNTDVFFPKQITPFEYENKTILYVGRIHPEKGISLLIEAFSILYKQFPQVRLRIVGPHKEEQGGGGESFLRVLQEKADGLPVELHPPVFNHEKLAEIYRTADIFCYPSLAEQGESFGVAPLEAMACGLVPVVSNLDCFKDFITDGKTGYFFNHRSADPHQQLANTLLKALLTWETTMKIAENAIQHTRNFSYQTIAKQYLSEFETLFEKNIKQ